MRRIPRALQILFWPLSIFYGCVVRAKRWLYEHGWLKAKRLDGAVISVGNVSTGGTGKTPMVMWLAEKFLAEGKSVAILTRGYKGSHGTSDEVEVMKRHLGDRVRFGVGADRYAEGRKLEAEKKVDIFLLDDGFQHLKLARDVDVVLVNASREWETEKLLPAGFLREPLSKLRKADIVVAFRVNEIKELPTIADRIEFHATAMANRFRLLRGSEISGLPRVTLLAFCGIASPESFQRDLEMINLAVVGLRVFADHHRYSASDVARIETEANSLGAEGLVTTEKDEANLVGLEFRMPVWVAVSWFGLHDENLMIRRIHDLLRKRHVA